VPEDIHVQPFSRITDIPKLYHNCNCLPYLNVNESPGNAYRILVGKPEGRRPLGRPRRRWVENIKMDLGEIGWDGMDWVDLA
jgi:hypothetical protein